MNRLSHETSPYLQQHATNPVDWYPWGEEALEKARRENKPILLSIGYASCHWCHVMAHESFEDAETAKLMNELFVNVKVDREERPDLDKIYQTAHQMLSHSGGGWPLTVFLTPEDFTPFFTGTYFPPEAKYQLPSFKQLLRHIADVYQNRFHDIQQQNAELQQILRREAQLNTDVHLTLDPIARAIKIFQQNYDTQYGGFGGAPKFPQAAKLNFLFENHAEMFNKTLRHMSMGGIYDQLAGGFYRYSVDDKWRIPHFEKMLYDNAQLIYLYAKAAKENIVRETADWIIAEMQSAEGGYYSSLDADSEGKEGKYYVWDKKEIENNLTAEEFIFARYYFGLDYPPNFEKHYHLYVAEEIELVATHLKITVQKAHAILSSIKEKLLRIRSQRIAPHRDEKVLTSWNSLMIKALLVASDVLNEPRYSQSALRALDFIQNQLWQDQRLLVSYKDGKAHLPAYLDDYAFLIDALLTALTISWETEYLLMAIELADIVLEYFYDADHGGFFFTASDHEKLLYRPKTYMDEAIPSGNGVAVRVLLTLGYLLGDSRYLDAVEKTLRNAWPMLTQFPSEHTSLLLALRDFINPPKIIILRGEENAMQSWREHYRGLSSMVFAIPEDAVMLPDALALKKPQGKVCAYVCEGMQCLIDNSLPS